MNRVTTFRITGRLFSKWLAPACLGLLLITSPLVPAAPEANTIDFQSVPAGAALKSRALPAPVFPTRLQVDITQFGEKDRHEINLRGRLQLVRDKKYDQYLLFQPVDKTPPIAINMALPVDVKAFISPDKILQLRYSAESTVLGNSKDLLIQQDDNLLKNIQRYGNEPVVEAFNGITIRQANIKHSAPEPYSAYYYALPVAVTDSQGKTTHLWPGEFTQFESAEKKKLGIYILVSDVAKPKGVAANLMEGAAYGLQIAITQKPL